jgi:predicted nucleic acid-binding protein
VIKAQILLDTEPLVAALNRRDHFHSWVTGELARIEPPLLSCEAVLSEACFLLRNVYGGSQAVISLVNTGVIQIPFRLHEEAGLIGELLVSYSSVPMSLADACLVRMAEQCIASMVLTLDSDFKIYRKHRNQMIPVIMPSSM